MHLGAVCKRALQPPCRSAGNKHLPDAQMWHFLTGTSLPPAWHCAATQAENEIQTSNTVRPVERYCDKISTRPVKLSSNPILQASSHDCVLTKVSHRAPHSPATSCPCLRDCCTAIQQYLLGASGALIGSFTLPLPVCLTRCPVGLSATTQRPGADGSMFHGILLTSL